MTELKLALTWPDEHLDGRREMFVTFDSFSSPTGRRRLDKLERRSKYLLRYLGGKLSQLRGSQVSHTGPYCVEIFAHEYAHVLHHGITGHRPIQRIDEISEMGVDYANENEILTAASTTLVLEYLELSYDLYGLISSTLFNLQGARCKVARELYFDLKARRELLGVQEVAKVVARRLLKIQTSA